MQKDYPFSTLNYLKKQPLMLGISPRLYDETKRGNTNSYNSTDFKFIRSVVQIAEYNDFDFTVSTVNWNYPPNYIYYDSMTVASALVACTNRMLCIGTVNPLLGPIHPLNFARSLGTLDAISGSRIGVNFVTGYVDGNNPWDMFCQPTPVYEERHDMLSYFVDELNEAWKDGTIVNPRPRFGAPVMVGAGSSQKSIDFVNKYCDMGFVAPSTSSDFNGASQHFEKSLKDYNKDVALFTTIMIVSRDTPEETNEYLHKIAPHYSDIDYRNNPGFMSLGSNVELIGTPDEIANQLEHLNLLGLKGAALQFKDFKNDLSHFTVSIIPKLKEKGLRL